MLGAVVPVELPVPPVLELPPIPLVLPESDVPEVLEGSVLLLELPVPVVPEEPDELGGHGVAVDVAVPLGPVDDVVDPLVPGIQSTLDPDVPEVPDELGVLEVPVP